MHLCWLRTSGYVQAEVITPIPELRTLQRISPGIADESVRVVRESGHMSVDGTKFGYPKITRVSNFLRDSSARFGGA